MLGELSGSVSFDSCSGGEAYVDVVVVEMSSSSTPLSVDDPCALVDIRQVLTNSDDDDKDDNLTQASTSGTI